MPFAVMISHSTKEKQIAEVICERLEAAGFSCWMAPRNIPAGAEWTAAILEGIASSRLMVLVFSASANESKHVSREVLYAGDNHIPVLPFRVQETVPTGAIAYYLLGVQWLDAWRPPLEEHIGTLVSRVRRLLSDGAAAAQQVPEPPAEATSSLAEKEIQFECVRCKQSLAIDISGAGMEVECPTCGQSMPVPLPPLPLTAEARDAITRHLTLILGPIAPHLVKTTMARVSTVSELCQTLAGSIPDQKDRAAFLKAFCPVLPAAHSSFGPSASQAAESGSAPVAWKPETLDALKSRLGVYLGPMANLVVDRTARKARTLDELHNLLAAQITSPADREKWRKSLPRSN